MKHAFTLINATIPRPNIANLEMQLELWDDADPTTGAAEDIRIFSKETKTSVAGMTIEQLLARIQPQIKLEVQGYIDAYEKGENIENNTLVLQMVSNIDGGLV
ncbi:MAG: hypothetical protein MUO31_06760 [Thermodesulfovibrionales bacterium]|nr:hypothetical protein [Thermodesulfovibrionales bacterium]